MTTLTRPSALLVALLVALGLNLFLGSVIAGQWMQAESAPARWDAASLIERRAAQLSAADAQVLREVFVARQGALDAEIEALRAAREEARAAIGAAELEVAQLAAAFAEVRVRTTDLQAGFHDLYLEVAPQLSREGRSTLLERRARSGGSE
jgi:uncharacterized membrane protein